MDINQNNTDRFDEAIKATSVTPQSGSAEKQSTSIDNDLIEENAQVVNQAIEETPVVNDKEDFIVNTPQIKQNIVFEDNVTEPLPNGLDYRKETVNLPTDTVLRTYGVIESAPNVNMQGTKNIRDWAEVEKQGRDLNTFGEMFLGTLENPEAEFHQKVQSEVGPLQASHPKFKASENQTLEGERAVMRLMNHLGRGAIFRTPLWSTGIWLTFKAPSEGSLLELFRQLVSEKIEFGRSTYGLAFANTSSYMTDRLISFALEHVYQSTLITTKDLKDIISCQDIPTIIWGLACSVWPQGFQYRRSCIADVEKCQHIIEEKLNLSKILWTNTKGLTKWQIAHMANMRTNSMTEESVAKYKQEMLCSQNRVVEVNKEADKSIKITLKVPTISEYVDSGYRWINNIVEVVTNALGTNASNNERNNYIIDQGRATAVRQYTHWIEKLEFDTNTIEDMETIEQSMDVLSAEDDFRIDFMKAIDTYINDSAISVVGIPSFTCPKCQKENIDPNASAKHANILPIDVYQTFFILLVLKRAKIQSR